jgi:hypothetical protein
MIKIIMIIKSQMLINKIIYLYKTKQNKYIMNIIIIKLMMMVIKNEAKLIRYVSIN